MLGGREGVAGELTSGVGMMEGAGKAGSGYKGMMEGVRQAIDRNERDKSRKQAEATEETRRPVVA